MEVPTHCSRPTRHEPVAPPEAGLSGYLGEDSKGVLGDLAILLLGPDLQDLLQLLLLVLVRMGE